MKLNPLADGLPVGFNPDHYVSFELHGGNGRWWVGYSYPDVHTSDPDKAVIAHRCAEGWPALINELPMESITGPGITFDRVIWCAECQDAGKLVAGRWASENKTPREAGTPVPGKLPPPRPALMSPRPSEQP